MNKAEFIKELKELAKIKTPYIFRAELDGKTFEFTLTAKEVN